MFYLLIVLDYRKIKFSRISEISEFHINDLLKNENKNYFRIYYIIVLIILYIIFIIYHSKKYAYKYMT